MDVDLIEVEQQLCRIPEVTAARIVADEIGRLTEVHILATPDKAAKQVVRDVQSVAITNFGLEIDRRIISVVELPGSPGIAVAEGDEGEVDAAREDTERILIDDVSLTRNRFRCRTEVALRRGAGTAQGAAEGAASASSTMRLVARATIEAMRKLEPAAARADVEAAEVVHLGSHQVAMVSVVLSVPPYEEVVVGAAVVRSSGEHDAMARAVLAATNRRLQQLR